MTDKELRDAAVAEFTTAQSYYHKTTQGYVKNPNGSNWKAGDAAFGRGMSLLGQIGQAPPPNPWQDFIGVCAYRDEDLDNIAAPGIRHVRRDMYGAKAANIVLARSFGIETLPIADYCPWPDLNGGRDDKYPPLPQFYGEWCKRMLDNWRGMSQPPPAIEVWNEPWLPNFWRPQPDPVAYYQLVLEFNQQARAIWPNVTILWSADEVQQGENVSRKPWIAAVLAADTLGLLRDPRVLPTVHNYAEGRTPTQTTGEPCMWQFDRYKCAYQQTKAHGHPDPKVWVTEYGWESGVVGEANQAAYIKQGLEMMYDSGMVARAYAFFMGTNDSWSYNWLRPDNTEKPVCMEIRTKLN